KQLDHPCIVRFLESGTDRNRFWFAMEFVDGPSFESLRDGRGRVPWPEVLDLAWQIAPALKHAHDRGVIHRDLKPSNLMRAADPHAEDGLGRIKLTDFGISSLFASPHLTVTGGVIGTPEYLSPEQAAGKPVTKKSDLYSLGVVLYTLITGDTPFQGSPVDLLHKHRYGQFDRPARIVPDLPPDLDDIICQLLAKDPGQRIPDGGVLHRRLDNLRRKLIRQTNNRTESPAALETPASAEAGDRMGPATFASRFVRKELEDQKLGGPVARFFNQPAVLVTLFVLCVAALGWTFWPLSAAGLFQRGAALMASADPDDWEKAFERFLDPLDERFPGHAHQADVAALRVKLEDARAERRAERAARGKAEMSEANWFFEQGMRQRRQGDEDAARATWTRLVAAFGDVPAERPWVRKAKQQLDAPVR
ncbi:MAG: protein kinase domain-containing protein, partial [Gemmataceae bacterium]